MTPKDNQPSDDTRNIDPRRAAREEQGHIMPKRIEDALNPRRVGMNRYKIADGQVVSRQYISHLRKGRSVKRRMNMTSGIGYTLRLLQDVTGISNKELCEKTGLAPLTITNLRRNTNSNPKLSTLTLLANVFELEIAQFITFSEKVSQLYEEEKASGQD